MFAPVNFQDWPPEREKKLKAIKRYSMFEKMFYRSNLWMHTYRMLWMIEAAAELAEKHLKVDINRARVLALVHDDAEIVTGDIQAGHKKFMSKDELQKVAEGEAAAIEELTGRYPKMINGYVYRELLLSALQKNDVEAQLVMYFDKLDAFCESLHEVLAGNIIFLRAVIFYTKTMAEFPIKNSLIVDFLNSKELSLTWIDNRESPLKVLIERYTYLNHPHTKESIYRDSDFPFYNTWRSLVIKRAGEEGIRWLTEQKVS